jgi:putative PIN family toxin of toxin-antitoxin system
MRNKKVILDTNLWISFLISKNLSEIDDLVNVGKIKLIFSNELIEEFIAVAKRPKFKKYFNNDNLEELLRLFEQYGKLIRVRIEVTESRDKKDNFLLSLAVESNADFLVTGDTDLLILKKIKKTKIVTWNDFMKEIK